MRQRSRGLAILRAAALAAFRAAVLLLAASAVIFLATEALPGDAAEIRSGGRATPTELVRLRNEIGLDRPIVVRYASWLGGVFTGRPGRSLITGSPVADLVRQRVRVTLTLTLAALVVAVPLMVAWAWLGALGPRRLRSAVVAIIVAGAAVPQVVVATGLAALLSAALGLVPPVSLFSAGTPPWHQPELLVLPTLTLALPSAAYGAGILHGAMVDAASRPFVRDAVLRGLSPGRVLVRYLLPVVAAAAARMLAVIVGGLVAGSAVAESIFGVAGLGQLLVTAVGGRDIPVVQGVALLAAVIVVGTSLFADAVAIAVDPHRGRAQTLRRRGLAGEPDESLGPRCLGLGPAGPL